MSYTNEVFMQRSIAQAAQALDLVNACRNHKLAADSGKHRTLALIMKEASERFQKLAAGQTVVSAEDFFRLSIERSRQVQRETAALMKIRREKRERDAAEREAVLADMQRAGIAA
ncbi:hypothetical protein [Agrobacterium sp. CG674]